MYYREDPQMYLPVVCLDIRRVVDMHTRTWRGDREREREMHTHTHTHRNTHSQEISFRSPAVCGQSSTLFPTYVPILFVDFQLLCNTTGPPNMISQETLMPEMLAECRLYDLT